MQRSVKSSGGACPTRQACSLEILVIVLMCTFFKLLLAILVLYVHVSVCLFVVAALELAVSLCVCVFRSHCDSCIMLPPVTEPCSTDGRCPACSAALVPFIRCTLSSVFCMFFASLYVTQFGSCTCFRDRIIEFLLYLSTSKSALTARR